ncbi:MAG: hypothetical protein AAF652_00155 [Cyanobacteria bacterium P01_C01_bin.72]
MIIGLLFPGLLKPQASVSEPTATLEQKQSKSGRKEKFAHAHNITHQLIGSRIITQFAPQNELGENLDLEQLAADFGYEQFNWTSYVIQDPYGIQDQAGKQLNTPYNDPPKGGYIYDPADHLPFYWDLEKCYRCQSRHHWQNQNNLQPFALVFEDSPADYRLQPGEVIEFITSLVGIKQHDIETQTAAWEILHTFRWQLVSVYPNVSKVSLVDSDVNLNTLSPILLSTMEVDGAILDVE